MRVLCTGDLHIGRRPTRLPHGVDVRDHTCARLWENVVAYAVDQQVDVLALSGDVVDRANRYFEALDPLKRGLERLAEAGIVTVAVSGNHDFDVLPQLERVLARDSFRLIGRGGQWQRETVTSRAGELLHVDGWSFPSEHWPEDPLLSYPRVARDDIPVLGLLHGDLDVTGSRYAPVRLADLRICPVDVWLLGHVHAPARHEIAHGATVLYPGSPQAMDPGEPGLHGVWMLDIVSGAPPVLRQIPLATVRYETLMIDVTGASDGDLLRTAVVNELGAAVARIGDVSGPLRHLVLRLRLTGRTALHGRAAAELEEMIRDYTRTEGDATAYVERVVDATRPEYDLLEIAKGTDAPGALARLLIEISSEGATSHALLHGARNVAAHVRGSRAYRGLPVSPEARQSAGDVPSGVDDDTALRQLLAAQANTLLDTLMMQKHV